MAELSSVSGHQILEPEQVKAFEGSLADTANCEFEAEFSSKRESSDVAVQTESAPAQNPGDISQAMSPLGQAEEKKKTDLDPVNRAERQI